MKYGCLMRDKMILSHGFEKPYFRFHPSKRLFYSEDPIELNLNVSLSWKMKWNVFLSSVLSTYKDMWCEVCEHSINLGWCLR